MKAWPRSDASARAGRRAEPQRPDVVAHQSVTTPDAKRISGCIAEFPFVRLARLLGADRWKHFQVPDIGNRAVLRQQPWTCDQYQPDLGEPSNDQFGVLERRTGCSG